MRMLGALPENTSVWAYPSGQLARPGDKGATQNPPRDPIPALAPVLQSYPPLPIAGDFPYEIKQPFITRNVAWYTGGPILNIGQPTARNDYREFIRSAMVDSDWDRLEIFCGWYLATKATTPLAREMFYRSFNFGTYKWVWQNGRKKYLPFSRFDYQTFFERLKRFESGKDATRSCVSNSVKLHLVNLDAKQAQVGRGVPMILTIGFCPIHQSWTDGLLKMAGFVAIAVGGAYALSFLGPAAGAAAPVAGGGAAAGGAAVGGAVTGGAVTGATVAATATTATAAAAAAGVTVLPEVMVVAASISAGAAATAAAAAAAGAFAVSGALSPAAGGAPIAQAPSLPPAMTPQNPTLLPEITVTGAPAGAAPGVVATQTAAVGSAPWLTQNVFETPFTGEPTTAQTFSDRALSALKEIAIDKGTDYAMEVAAEWYAKRLQKQMAEKMARELEAELARAQAEYDELMRRGATPEQAASQATAARGKFYALAALGVLAAFLLLRR